jgi:disulfide bond formation protein DsbB
MKIYTLVIVAMIVLLGSGLGFTHAQPPPTATPTLIPIQPTATSKYAGLRPTPTMFPTGAATRITGFDTRNVTGGFADTIINTYRFININTGGAFDIISFFALVLFLMALLVRLKNQLENRD